MNQVKQLNTIREKHRILLEKLKSTLENDSRYVALIICGSLATGQSREDSDVDLYLVATEDEYRKIKENKAYYFGNTGNFNDEEIEIDGKIISIQYLVQAAEKGNEPTRESFRDAFVLFDHSSKVEELIQNIMKYPEWERESRLKRFYSLFECSHYYATQALSMDNDFLKAKCLTDTVLYASRLVLTWNRLYYPCPKSLFSTLKKAQDIPAGFISKSKAVLNDPTDAQLKEYFDLVYEFSKELGMTLEESVGLILEDESSWFTDVFPAVSL